ncbi:hypothetical protein MTO96_015005, partial [Rhipicephalus appendiculatus]
MKPPKLPPLYFEILLCCATEFMDSQDASLHMKASDHRHLQQAVRLSTNVIDYAPAHAYGTATASTPTMKTERTGYLRAVGAEDFRGHGESVKMKPPKLPPLYFEILLCCATEFMDSHDASLHMKASDHRHLQHAVRLSTNVIDYAPAHAYGTATASTPTMKTERAGYLRAVGAEDFRGHGESVKMKPPKLPLVYFQ